jgi:biotin synthase
MLACPQANIPATTALATLDPARGYERALAWGANVIMPDMTPLQPATAYEIYPGRVRRIASREENAAAVRRRIEAAGRTVGCGHGGSPNWRRRAGDDRAGSPTVTEVRR